MSAPVLTADFASECADIGRRAKVASRQLATLSTAQKDAWLRHAADGLCSGTDRILAANARDLAAAEEIGLTKSQNDRLRLTPPRIDAAATGLREIALLPDPVGRVLDGGVRPNGLRVQKVGVPLGVILFIYESRPNVTLDAAAL